MQSLIFWPPGGFRVPMSKVPGQPGLTNKVQIARSRDLNRLLDEPGR